MFGSVLIANRGEIAVRIARTCHELGIRVIAVYSDADRAALHVRVADAAYRIGPPPARESYLNIAAIVSAAKASGAEAVHPGYGFLSENPAFAEAVTEAGVVFIGPPASAIRAMGDKAEAKRLVASVGVPVVPGYQGDDQSSERLRAEAERVGFPLLIKASGGGGGRGMREVRDAESFAEQLEAARREALAAFGDDRVLLERLVQGARHVEVQVFGDAQGSLVYLGERDCSTQRRHQKVIEEAPSPAVDPDLRRRMGEAAVLAAKSAGYTNAGTVEFLLGHDGAFYFLEMNTRLQVEHPVTEFVTGLDLVRLQLEVATGAPLPMTQDEVRIAGHAIEVRLYAEDPGRNYLPSSGRLRTLGLPATADARVDRGYDADDTVSPYYDALLLKLIVVGESRPEVIQRLARALGEVDVVGVATNLSLLRSIVDSDAFHAGAMTTDYLEAHPELVQVNPRPAQDAIFAVAGFLLTEESQATSRHRDPWRSGAWRATGAAQLLAVTIDGRQAGIEVRPGDARNSWLIDAGDGQEELSFERSGDELIVRRGNEVATYEAYGTHGPYRTVTHAGESFAYQLRSLPTPDAATATIQVGAGGGKLVAPMPGLIVKLQVAEGDSVREHQTLAVLEAMKMEQAIQANMDGRVKAVHVKVGDRVTGGAVLIELEAASEEPA